MFHAIGHVTRWYNLHFDRQCWCPIVYTVSMHTLFTIHATTPLLTPIFWAQGSTNTYCIAHEWPSLPRWVVRLLSQPCITWYLVWQIRQTPCHMLFPQLRTEIGSCRQRFQLQIGSCTALKFGVSHRNPIPRPWHLIQRHKVNNQLPPCKWLIVWNCRNGVPSLTLDS